MVIASTPSRALIAAIPKAELHVHLEGAIAGGTLMALARKHGIDLGQFTDDDLYAFDDLAGFLRIYDIACESMRDAADFELVTYEALARITESGGRYVEMFFSPQAHVHATYGTMLDGIRAGLSAAYTDFDIVGRIIPAHNRELGPDAGRAFVDMVVAHRTDFVIGIGLDYMENDPRPFAPMFEDARRAGLHVTAHAGEIGPASNVRDSIDILGCERIDHGYHVVDDAALMARCRKVGTYFTCCPTTTLMTTQWKDPSKSDHAIRQMLKAGLIISINTDDPGLMKTTLTDEYVALYQMGATISQLTQIALNGIRMSWMDEVEKRTTLDNWSREIAALV